MIRWSSLGRALENLRRHETKVTWLAAAGLLLFSCAALLDRHLIGDTSPIFWDLTVYTHAVDLLAAGKNPYDSTVLHQAGVPPWLYFISPPGVALLFEAIARSPLRPLFMPALVMLHFAAMIGTPLLLGRMLFGASAARLTLAAGAFCTLFAAAGIGAISAMNNGSFLYLLIVMAATAGLKRRDWTAFHIVVTGAMIFKPYYVFFWIIPTRAHGFSWRQAATAVCLALLAALTYILPLWIAPGTFYAWAENVMTTLAIGDIGVNVFGALSERLTAAEPSWLPHAAQLAFIALLAALLMPTRLAGRRLWAALFVGAVFMNPRPLGYDAAIAAIPLAFLAATLLPQNFGFGWRLVVSTCGLAGAMLVLAYDDRVLPADILFPALAAGVLALATARAGFRRWPRRITAPALRRPAADAPLSASGRERRLAGLSRSARPLSPAPAADDRAHREGADRAVRADASAGNDW